MISYNDLYEILRKEKYSEALQLLPREFLTEVAGFLSENKSAESADSGFFQDSVLKSKKQFENSQSIFRELMLRRKRKILNLVFVATETGIMKRDYENMLLFEREIFDKMVKIFEDGDKEVARTLQGVENKVRENKIVIFHQDVEQFVDMTGKIVGPFISGELANLETPVGEILVAGGKARFVDEG